MGLKAMAAAKIGKVFKPVANATAKVMAKLDANKPEIMVCGGVVMVLVGTVWMIVQTRKVDTVMADGKEKIEQAEEKKGEITEAEFRKLVTKVRSETVWAFVKLYGLPALTFITGIFTLVGGHWVLKKRYILTATSLEGMKKFMEFVKQNVIEDAGEEKWEQYSKGVVGKRTVEAEITDADGKKIKQTAEVLVCKPHDNPWRIEYSEELFKSWKPDAETNLFFLQGVEGYFDHKYQTDKDYEVSMYEILDYIGADWTKFTKEYRQWLRDQLWGHHIYGDDRISLGLHMEQNTPARRRLSDKVFIEFNAEGESKDIINRYRDPAYLAKEQAGARKKK